MKNVFGLITGIFNKMKKKPKDNYFTELVKENNPKSAINFFLLATLGVGVILLAIPIVGMLVDIWYNHTITINLSDMALYIGAVAAIFTSGGITSAWTEFAYSKYDVPPIDDDGNDMVVSDDTDISTDEDETPVAVRRRRYRKANK